MENIDHQYPQKPTLLKRKSKRHISITIMSIVLFALTFSLIINDYYLIFLLLGVLLFHELGHFLLMKLFNYEELNMLFIPFMGAMVSGRKKKYSQVESALMIIAGPLPGILLGASLLIYNWLPAEALSIQVGVLLIILNVMNLAPIEPLDGGKLVRVLFFNKFELAQLIFSVISSLAIMGIGIYFNSIVLTIFGFLLGFRIKGKHKMYLIRKDMEQEGINYESNYEDLSNKAFSKIKNILIEHTPVLKDLEEYEEAEKYGHLMAKQVDGVLFPPMKKDASIWFKIFMLLLWSGGIFISIYAIFNKDINSIVNAFQNR